MAERRVISELEYESRVTRAGLWALAGVLLLAMGALLQYLAGPISSETCYGYGYPTISQWVCSFTYETSSMTSLSGFGFILLLIALVQWVRVDRYCQVVRPFDHQAEPPEPSGPNAGQQAPQSPMAPTDSFCPSCGSRCAPGSSFCSSCGHEVGRPADEL